MSDKRKMKVKRKEEEFEPFPRVPPKPTKDELAIAKWMKKNVPVKRTKFAGHYIEYFTGSKAVDALMNSEWALKEEGKFTMFATREDVARFLHNLLTKNFFHRAKKVPVTELELMAKMKKKDKKPEKDLKKKKDDDDTEGKEMKTEGEKKCKKIKLEMHFSQVFVDNLDAYVWLYDPIPLYYWAIGTIIVLGAIAVCLFPLWPPTVRMGVQYLSMAAAGLLIVILVLTMVRLIVFCVVWLLTYGKFHLWLLPNLTEDVGFFASFWPLYEYQYGDVHSIGRRKNKKKKKQEEEEKEKGKEKGVEKSDVSKEEIKKDSEMKKLMLDEGDHGQGGDKLNSQGNDDKLGGGSDSDEEGKLSEVGSKEQTENSESDFEKVNAES